MPKARAVAPKPVPPCIRCAKRRPVRCAIDWDLPPLSADKTRFAYRASRSREEIVIFWGAPRAIGQTPGVLIYATRDHVPVCIAFLRGVSPHNLSMATLRACLDTAGYADVRTVLSSGNVVFSTRATSVESLERRLSAEITQGVGRTFGLTIRSVDYLTQLVESDPFQTFAVPKNAKRVISFLQLPVSARLDLPIARDGVQIFAVVEREVFTAYGPHPKGPVFMTMLERAFGKDITTRTLDTVKKCAGA